jgi:6-phosphogluconolactonase (cycloisomerase 2 family)
VYLLSGIRRLASESTSASAYTPGPVSLCLHKHMSPSLHTVPTPSLSVPSPISPTARLYHTMELPWPFLMQCLRPIAKADTRLTDSTTKLNTQSDSDEKKHANQHAIGHHARRRRKHQILPAQTSKKKKKTCGIESFRTHALFDANVLRIINSYFNARCPFAVGCADTDTAYTGFRLIRSTLLSSTPDTDHGSKSWGEAPRSGFDGLLPYTLQLTPKQTLLIGLIRHGAPQMVQIREYDREANHIRTFGHYGSDTHQGGLETVSDIAVTAASQIIVCRNMDHGVSMFSRKGKFIRHIGKLNASDKKQHTPLDHISGVAVNSRGDVIVSDRRHDRLRAFDAKDGHVLFDVGGSGGLGGSLYCPRKIVVDKHDRIFVLDFENGKIKLFSHTGEFIRQVNPPSSLVPQDFTLTTDGLIVMLDSDGIIAVLSDSGDELQRYSVDGLSEPESIAISYDGCIIYIADTEHQRIETLRMQWHTQSGTK